MNEFIFRKLGESMYKTIVGKLVIVLSLSIPIFGVAPCAKVNLDRITKPCLWME